MSMFRRLLVPVDLTDKNRRAVEVAADLVRGAEGAQVTLLHVIEPLDLPFAELQDFYEELEGRARESMVGLGEILEAAGITHQERVIYGDRGREIVRCAEEEDFDLLVLSSHRQDPEDPARNLGTLSHKVAILSQRPVLLVK